MKKYMWVSLYLLTLIIFFIVSVSVDYVDQILLIIFLSFILFAPILSYIVMLSFYNKEKNKQLLFYSLLLIITYLTYTNSLGLYCYANNTFHLAYYSNTPIELSLYYPLILILIVIILLFLKNKFIESIKFLKGFSIIYTIIFWMSTYFFIFIYNLSV